MDLSLDDLVCLYLLEREPSSETGGPDGPDPRSPTGIAAGIGIEPDDISGRLDVFETVTTLTAEGSLTETVRTTDGGERNVYELSPDGRERARTLREQVLTAADGIDEPGDRTLRELVTAEGEPSLGAILARLSPDGSPLGAASSGDRFVGRRAARSTLVDALEAIEPRGGRTILVTGDRGVGKSMLVSQLIDRARETDVTVGRSACRRDSDEPYGPLRRAIEDAFDASVCAPLSETDGRGTDDAASLSARRSALVGDVADAVCDRSTAEPTVLFVDDLHWAGESTIALFERLATASAVWVYPLLLVGAYRPAAVASDTPLGAMCDRLSTTDRVSELALDPFDWAETGRFVRRRVRGPVPDAVVDRIHEASGGVPLIVDEAVTTMLESGTGRPADDVDPFDALDVPAGAERAIERRLDPLDEDGRAVIEAASVVGRTVPYDVLRSIVPLSDPDLREYVRLLVSANILAWADESATDELAFSSDLVRGTVRAGIDPDRNRRLHGQVADALVEADAAPSTIAHHCEAAGQDGRAIDHYERAAERARNRYAGEAAVETYERALELVAGSELTERAPSIHLELAVTRFLRGEFDAAAEHFATARDRTDDRTVRCRAAHRLAEIQVKRGAVETGIETAETALEAATEAVPAADRCRLHRVLGWGRLQAGDLAGARDAFERQLAVAESAADPTLCALAEHDLGTLAGKTGDVEGAEGRLSDAVATFDRLDEPNLQSKSLTNLALVYRRSGDLEAAIEANDRALAIQREHGFYETLPDSQLNQALLYRARGRLDRAVEEFEAAIETATDVGRDERVAKARTNLAAVLTVQGRLDQARRRCGEAIETFERLEATDGLILASTTRARIRVLAGEYGPARADAERAVSLATDLGNDDRIAAARNALGQVCRATGDLDGAQDHHRASVQIATEGGDDVTATSVRIELVADVLAAGAAGRARDAAADAVAAAAETEERLLRARARTRFGRACTDCGDHERAATALERALETQAESGATVDRCETLLARCHLELERDNQEAAAEALDVATALIDEYGIERYAERARTHQERLR